MLDLDTFLTALYVMVDDFCKTYLSPEVRPGPEASLSRSEIVTLAVLGQWGRFASERDFYRFAGERLREAFPTLPARSQFNRLVRRHREAITAFALFLPEAAELEALDLSAARVRDRRRRGRSWLVGQADYGHSSREGSFFGFQVMFSVAAEGDVTGFCFAPGSAKEQTMAELFFALRRHPDPRLASVGGPSQGEYLADKGFAGRQRQVLWKEQYGATVLSLVPSKDRYQLPKAWRRRIASLRQIVETVYDKIHNSFRLRRERPHDVYGFASRLAAKVALHNFCLWLNRQLGRKPLAFADLLGW